MTVATLTSKGQTTIPKQVRELKGLLKRRDGKVLSIEEMNAAIARGAAGKR